ncbi:hypothetical protein [Dyella sedimenti]|uniref:hypothetical protein n=1 Tax=Dyella sedimenti TaxID=2919947 RepID=UPI001FA9C475|nr:hypothetical protein [Dyella sedimenti]
MRKPGFAVVLLGWPIAVSAGGAATAGTHKLDVPPPFNTNACGGACLEYVSNGYVSTLVARDPASGAVLKTFNLLEIPTGASFGKSELSDGAGVPTPAGNGPVSASTPVYDARSRLAGYQVTTYVFAGGAASNVASVYVPLRPR